MTASPAPETSIIIRTFNEQKHLPALFDALAMQSYRDFEVIVVDSGSFDQTRHIAETRAAQVIRISSHDFTYGFSLNVGIKAARGKFLAIASAHTVPCNEHWLESLITPLRDDKTAMTYGRQIGAASSKFSEVEDMDRTFGPLPRTESPNQWAVNNANSAIRKDLWEQQGFDEKLLGLEDIEWARHWMDRDYRVVYVPQAILTHIHEESWTQIKTRYYREAVSARQMGVFQRRQIPGIIIREGIRTTVDAVRAFGSHPNPVKTRLTKLQCAREIIYFRLNKLIGQLHGLIAAHPLESREEREDVLFKRTGQAVVIEGPGKAVIKDIEIPDLKPGEVLIRVAHVAVCATDLEILDGSLGYYKDGMSDYPIVPGHEFSGKIAAIGSKVEGIKEGDLVVAECIQSCGTCSECHSGNFIGCAERTELGVLRRNGAYAEYVTVPSRFVHVLPNTFDLRRATLIEPLAVCLKGLNRIGPFLDVATKTPLRCAVLGSGPLGHMFSLVLRHLGHEVVAYDRNPRRRALFDGTGIEASEEIKALKGFSLIVEITGDPQVLNEALLTSQASATVLLLGLPYGKREFSFEAIAAYDKAVAGSVGSTASDFKKAIELLPQLNLTPYFESTMPLCEFERAWAESRSGQAFKVILDV